MAEAGEKAREKGDWKPRERSAAKRVNAAEYSRGNIKELKST